VNSDDNSGKAYSTKVPSKSSGRGRHTWSRRKRRRSLRESEHGGCRCLPHTPTRRSLEPWSSLTRPGASPPTRSRVDGERRLDMMENRREKTKVPSMSPSFRIHTLSFGPPLCTSWWWDWLDRQTVPYAAPPYTSALIPPFKV
jgi:hypothetical protein